MKLRNTVITLIMGIQLISQTTWASPESLAGLVAVNNKKLYVEYTKPAAGKPTVVLVNGLTHATRNWARLIQNLVANGYGVVTYDMAGMGTTLLSNPLPTKPIFYNEQAADLKSLLVGLRIKAPYNLIGLSYGGGIISAFVSKHSKDVGNLIMINPYTEFLESQKVAIKKQIDATRRMFPSNPATDEELTDYFIRQMVYTTYPIAEPSILENPYKLEGVTRMVQGIRMYQPIEDVRFLPARSLHLVISEQDEYIPQDVYKNYWNATAAKSRASMTLVKYSKHKIPESYPRFLAQFIKGVLDRQPLLFNGDVLVANPLTLEIVKK